MTETSADRFPIPHTSWTATPLSASHPSFLQPGTDNTPGKKAYFIYLEAREGHEDAVLSFLRDINAGVDLEPGTGPWFGLRYSQRSFAIFEAFPDAERRHDHDAGPGGRNFTERVDELREHLVGPAVIYRLDVMFGKFGTMFGEEVGPVGR
jgi:quinol monooxygenase YgiN